MGKRSNFERVERDFYPTPYEAVIPLLPFLTEVEAYYEPCCGKSDLVLHLSKNNIKCAGASDLPIDATTFNYNLDGYSGNVFITNPPWDRKVLHPIILNLSKQKPTWLLFDADWMHTKQSHEYMQLCKMIVSVGRVKWIPGSKMTGKDNCCWYLFDAQPHEFNNPIFIGR